MISRASTVSQLSAPTAGSWEEAGGRCVIISFGLSKAGESVVVLLFLLPKADTVVVCTVLLVITLFVVPVVVPPRPVPPAVDAINSKQKLVSGKSYGFSSSS